MSGSLATRDRAFFVRLRIGHEQHLSLSWLRQGNLPEPIYRGSMAEAAQQQKIIKLLETARMLAIDLGLVPDERALDEARST